MPRNGTSTELKKAFDQVAQDEAEKLSIAQETMIKSTDYLRRIIAPVGGQGVVTMSYLCPHCNSFPLEDGKGATIGGARSVERNTIGSNQTGFWSYTQVKVSIRPRNSKHMQYFRAFALI